MKKFVEIAWNAPIDKKLFDHLRNDFRYNSDHLKVFDSVTQHSGNIDFHVDNTGIERKRFARVYNQVAESTLNELIRLAVIGYKRELEIKGKLEEN